MARFVDPTLPKLSVVLLRNTAKPPRRATTNSAGYDLYASEEMEVKPHNLAVVPTGLAIKVPYGTYGRIAPRSSLAVHYFIDVGAGVVDHDYRGEVKIVLFNFSSEVFKVEQGDRVAQLILEQISTPEVEIVESLESTYEGGTSDRIGGFGSTGK